MLWFFRKYLVKFTMEDDITIVVEAKEAAMFAAACTSANFNVTLTWKS